MSRANRHVGNAVGEHPVDILEAIVRARAGDAPPANRLMTARAVPARRGTLTSYLIGMAVLALARSDAERVDA